MLSYEAVRNDLMFIKVLRNHYTCDNSVTVLSAPNSSFWNEVRYKTQLQWNDFVNNEIEKLINHELRKPYIQGLRQIADDMLIDKAYFKRFSATPRIAWFTLLYMCKNCLIESDSLLEEISKKSMSVEEACTIIDEISSSHNLASASVKSNPGTLLQLQEEIPLGNGLGLDIADDDYTYCNCTTPSYEKINTSPVTHTGLIDEIMRHIDETPAPLKRKINYLNRLKKQWAKSYNNHLNDFDCIDVKNEGQVIYLWNYLKRKNLIPPFLEPIDTGMRYNMLISCLDNWSPSSSEIKKKLIKGMLHAWSEHKRQEKSNKNNNPKSK